MIQIEALLKLGIAEWMLIGHYEQLIQIYLNVVNEKGKLQDDLFGNMQHNKQFLAVEFKN